MVEKGLTGMDSSAMSLNKEARSWVPFNMYDFFGYIFPGVLFVSIVLLTLFESNDFSALIKSLFDKLNGSKTVIVVFAIFIAFVVVYLVGHIVATISHILIDRIIVGIIFKYPHETIIGSDKDIKKERIIAWPMQKLMAILALILPILIVLKIGRTFQLVIYGLIGIILFCRLVANILKTADTRFEGIEEADIKDIVKVCHFRSETLRVFGKYIKQIKDAEDTTKLLLKVGRLALLIMLSVLYVVFGIPGWFIEILVVGPIKNILSTNKSLDKNIGETIRRHIKEDFKFPPEEIGSDNYWIPCLYIIKNAVYERYIMNWLHLYSMNRNACMGSYLNLVLICYLIKVDQIGYPNLGEVQFLAFAMFAMTVLFGMRYLMLYYTYYTKNIYRFYYLMILENEKQAPPQSVF